MSIRNFIDAARREFPEVDEYFRLRPELEGALLNDNVSIEKIFAIVPSFAAILEKYGIKEKIQEDSVMNDANIQATARLLAQVFGHPWKIIGLDEILSKIQVPVEQEVECDQHGSCGDCECDETGDEINVVVTPSGELAYGVSDKPLTVAEEMQFFDELRKSDEGLKSAVADANHDPVNHPKHYTGHASGVECIELSEKLSFNLGNAFKYVFRRDDKENTYQDLSKAEWYLNREISRLTNMVETLPASVEILIHPGLSLGDIRKAQRVIGAEANANAADYFANLFENGTIEGEEDLYSLKAALDSLHALMEDVRREQDAAREVDPLGGWVSNRKD